MQRWEYKTIKLKTTGWLTGGELNAADFDGILNDLGDDGWELISAFDTNQAYGASLDVVAVFKRLRP